MKYRVVYICELGPDYEQLLRLHDITKEGHAAGHEMTLILKDVFSANSLMNNTWPATVVQAPVFLPRLRLHRQWVCLADTLQLAGYGDSSTLLSLVKTWQALLALLRADVVIFDHAPTAQLAATNLNCRKLIVGNGFNIPVAGNNLADWHPMQSRAELIDEQEQKVLKIINQVQRKLALPVSPTLSELYRCDRVVIDNYPQLDIYRGLRVNADYYASVTSYLPPVCSFRETEKPRVVCLLDPAFRKFTPLVEAMRASGNEILVIFRGADAERLKPYQSASFQFTTMMPDLELILKDADLFIGHGNIGEVTACMRLGKVMLLLPMQLEQLHVGVTLQAMGLAKVAAAQDNASDYQKVLTAILGSIKLRTTVRSFATTNRMYAQSTFGKGVVAAFDNNEHNLRQKI